MFNELLICFNGIDSRLSNSSNNEIKCLADNCRQLYSQTNKIISFANRYDFGEIKANGFWSFASLVLRFGAIVLEEEDEDNYSSLLQVSIVLLEGVRLSIHFSNYDNNNLFGTPPEEFTNLLQVFSTLTPQLDVIYGSYSSYWLCPSMRRTMNGFTALMAFYSQNCFPKTLWSKSCRAKTVAYIAQNANVEFVKSFWGLTEVSVFRHTLPQLSASSPNSVRDIFVPQQTQFIVSQWEAKVERRDSSSSSCSSSRVRCRLLSHSSSSSSSLSVVLHIHGGGFVSQSPDSHEVYLRDWARKLSNAVILSVDYSLSPEEKYPKALQQILDVYLWLTREENCFISLGFKPKQVVVCGDSAGGNLSVALVLVLQYIRNTLLETNIQMPRAVLSFYAPLILQTRASPSRLMTAVDTLLPLGVLLSCLEAYAPKQRPQEEEEEKKDSEEDFELIESCSSLPSHNFEPNWSLKWKHRIYSIKSRFLPQEWHQLPWYRQTHNLENRLQALNTTTSNAFISPLLSEETPNDVTLYLIGLHFDACLDDSVQMAKKWSGAVVFDVIDRLPHGFLNFVMISEEAQRASHLCLDRIKQSLI